MTNIYIWGLDLSGTVQGAGGVGGLLAVLRNGTPYFPCYDANGNVTDYVNANGIVVAHREYDPFGRTTIATGTLVRDLHFWFSTKYLDEESGLYYYGYRFYSPELMRFISRDLIEERGGLNLYGFVRNDPANRWDYLGKFSISIWRDPTEEEWDKLSIRAKNLAHKAVSFGTEIDTFIQEEPDSMWEGNFASFDSLLVGQFKLSALKGRGALATLETLGKNLDSFCFQ